MSKIGISGTSLMIDSKIEDSILSNNKIVKQPVKLSELSDVFNAETFEECSKSTRTAYRKEITKFLESDTIKNKLNNGTITLKELEENLSEVKTFGSLKKLRVFGVKVKGSKIKSTFLYFIPVKNDK